MITVDVALNRFPEFASSLEQAVEDSMDHGLITLLEVADMYTPVDTGALRGNIVISTGSGSREVTWVQHYAIYQNFGTSRGVSAKNFAGHGANAATEATQAALANWPNSGPGSVNLGSFL